MRNRIVSAVKPRSSLPPIASPNVYLQLRQQEVPATADRALDRGNTALFAGGTDLTGTTTNMWASGDSFTPPGDQDYQDQREEVRAFFDLSTLVKIGGFAVILEIFITAPPSEQSVIYDHSSGVVTTGGHLLKLTLSGGCQVDYRGFNNDGGLQSVAASGVLTMGAWNSVAYYFDMRPSTRRVYSFRNGEERDNNDINGQAPVGSAARGLGLFCRRSGATAVDRQLNAAGEGVRIRDLRFIRFGFDALPLMPAIASDAHKYRLEPNLHTLAGL